MLIFIGCKGWWKSWVSLRKRKRRRKWRKERRGGGAGGERTGDITIWKEQFMGSHTWGLEGPLTALEPGRACCMEFRVFNCPSMTHKHLHGDPLGFQMPCRWFSQTHFLCPRYRMPEDQSEHESGAGNRCVIKSLPAGVWVPRFHMERTCPGTPVPMTDSIVVEAPSSF